MNRRTLFERSELVRPPQAGVRPILMRPDGASIDIGRRSPAFPVTPPYIRIRIRRFGGLSDWPPGQTVLTWSPLAGLSTARFAASDSTLPRQPLGLHPYPLSGRPELLVIQPLVAYEFRRLHTTPHRSGLHPCWDYYALC